MARRRTVNTEVAGFTATPPPRYSLQQNNSNTVTFQERNITKQFKQPFTAILQASVSPPLSRSNNDSFVSTQGGVSPDGPYALEEAVYQHLKKGGAYEDFGYESGPEKDNEGSKEESQQFINDVSLQSQPSDLQRSESSVYNSVRNEGKSPPRLGYEPSMLGVILISENEGNILGTEESFQSSFFDKNSSFTSDSEMTTLVGNSSGSAPSQNSPSSSPKKKSIVEVSYQMTTAFAVMTLIWNIKSLFNNIFGRPIVKQHVNKIVATIIILFIILPIILPLHMAIWKPDGKGMDEFPMDLAAWDSEEFRALIANEVGTLFSREIQKVLERKVESGLNREEVLKAMRREMQEVFTKELLEKKYGTSRPDFALSTVGAKIIPHLTSLSYTVYPQTWSAKILSYVPWRSNIVDNAPVITIAPGIYDGLCWSFSGQKGVLAVKLAKTAHVTAVTYEHINKEIAVRDEVSPAPRDFEVWGLPEAGWEMRMTDFSVYLGTFTYNVEGSPRQIFTVTESKIPIRAVLFKIKNNWGCSQFTRIYRFRVHGDRSE